MSSSGQRLSHFGQLSYSASPPALRGSLRVEPEDFRVSETLSFEPHGQGEHVYLRVRKRLLTTREALLRLAKFASLSERAIGYAGLKDKFALTDQWFSLAIRADEEPDWAEIDDDRLQVLTVTRHARKLKRGALRNNHFVITVRKLDGDTEQLPLRFHRVSHEGVPNYFGEQRFGINDNNLLQARKLFASEMASFRSATNKRYQYGLYLSAARSFLFNRVLSHRVKNQNWNRILAGEIMALDQRRAWFAATPGDPDLISRLHDGDIHPSGPLWGKGLLPSSAEVAALENQIVSQDTDFCEGLERAKLKQERRALRVLLQHPQLQLQQDVAQISFALPAGCYATAVLRELINF